MDFARQRKLPHQRDQTNAREGQIEDWRARAVIRVISPAVVLRRLKKRRQRGFAIEYTLIALMLAFAAFQVLLAVGAKAGSI